MMVYCITTWDNMAHALLANFTMTWQRKFRTCSSAHLLKLAVFIGGNKSSRERKFQGAKAPGSESSRERTFQGAKVPHLELSLQGANGLGSEKSIIRLLCLSRLCCAMEAIFSPYPVVCPIVHLFHASMHLPCRPASPCEAKIPSSPLSPLLPCPSLSA